MKFHKKVPVAANDFLKAGIHIVLADAGKRKIGRKCLAAQPLTAIMLLLLKFHCIHTGKFAIKKHFQN